MFILFHLLTGLLIGYLLADRLGTRAVVLPCMFGALLPDLVDKPLGIFILAGALGGGRIFFHTLLFLLLLLLAGIIVYRRYGRPALLAVGVGVASHQALDVMWTQPKAWLFPLLGSFPPPIETGGWFLRKLLEELNNPFEWVSGAVLLVLLLPVLWPAGTSALVARYGRILRWLALLAAVPSAVLGLLLLAGGAFRRFSVSGWGDTMLWNALVSGAVLLLTAYAAYRLSVRLAEAPPAPGLVPGVETPSVPGQRE